MYETPGSLVYALEVEYFSLKMLSLDFSLLSLGVYSFMYLQYLYLEHHVGVQAYAIYVYMPPHVWISIDAFDYVANLGTPLEVGGCADDDLGSCYKDA